VHVNYKACENTLSFRFDLPTDLYQLDEKGSSDESPLGHWDL